MSTGPALLLVKSGFGKEDLSRRSSDTSLRSVA